MNENIDLTKILENCPKGTKLYSPLVGEVEFKDLDKSEYPIHISCNNGINELVLTKEGKFFTKEKDGECMLFPSKENRDWNKFKSPKPKFDPNTLKPFDRVLVRNSDKELWTCTLFSHHTAEVYPFVCSNTSYMYCIPYNEETKHLVGAKDKESEHYRYWED